jgi:hypothetical protein
MATLLSLPNELIINIYNYSPTLHAASCLSRTNERLHAVWLENINQITETILNLRLPAFEDALDLAILEENVASTPHYPGPVVPYLARVLCNADLAFSASTAFSTNWDGASNRAPLTSIHASYYLIRKIVFARQQANARLQEELYVTLCDSGYKARCRHGDLTTFLLRDADEDERRRHGISKNRDEWTRGEDMRNEIDGTRINVEEWDHVGDAMNASIPDWPDSRKRVRRDQFRGV